MPHVDATRARIYYEVHGDGPAIVFAHGAGGNAASWWQQIAHYVERPFGQDDDHLDLDSICRGIEASVSEILAR